MWIADHDESDPSEPDDESQSEDCTYVFECRNRSAYPG